MLRVSSGHNGFVEAGTGSGQPRRAAPDRRPEASGAVGTSLAVAAAVTFASSGPLAKSVMDAGMPSGQVTFLRIGLAAGLVLISALTLRPRSLQFHGRDWVEILGFGLFGVAGAQSFFFAAVARLPVAVAMLLEATAPVFVALWVRFVRRRRLPVAVWLGIGLAIVGLAAAAQVWRVDTLDVVGVLAGLGSALCASAYFLIGQRVVTTCDPLGVLTGSLLIGLLAVSVATPPWTVPAGSLDASAVLGGVALPVWLVIAMLAVASTVVPYLCGLTSLRHLPPSAASVLGLLEPVVAAVLAWWLLSQSLQAPQLLGGLAVLAGAAVVQVAIHRRAATAQAASVHGHRHGVKRRHAAKQSTGRTAR